MLDARANSIEYSAQLEIVKQLNSLITSKKLGSKKKETWKKLFKAARYLDIVGNKAVLPADSLSSLTYIYECLIKSLNLNRFPAAPGNVSITTNTIQIGIPGPQGPAGAANYLYFAWADDTSGTGYTSTYNPAKPYLAFIQSNLPILSLSASLFSGKWFRIIAGEGAPGEDGEDGLNGTNGLNGLDGRSVLNGPGDPVSGDGQNGDFWINTTDWEVFGPKASNVWPAGVSMIGADGADGENGNTILTDSGAPAVDDGEDGDIYIDTDDWDIYGPKTGGVWPAPVSLIGPAGDTGANGTDGQSGAEGIPGTSSYSYVAYADDITGTGYILVQSSDPTATLSPFNINKEWVAIIISSEQIGTTITASNFLTYWTRYKGDGDRWSTFSTTTLTIGTGNVLLTVEKSLAYTTGQRIVIALDGDPTTVMQGVVINYNPVSGQLSASIDDVDGSGTYSAWDVNLQAGLISPPVSIYAGASPTNITVGGLAAGTAILGLSYDAIIELMTQVYLSPSFSAFAMSGQSTTTEVGATISGSKTFTWTTTNSGNVAANLIKIQNITGGTTDLATTLADDSTEGGIAIGTVTKTSATSHVWRILGTNTNAVTFQRDFTVNWYWLKYIGTSTSTTLVEADIEALASTSLSSTFAGTYSLAAGGYKYFVWDDALGSPTAITGFKDTATNLAIDMADSTDHANYSNVANGWYYALVSVTNAQGVVSNKRVYRSKNILGGTITVQVS